MDSSLVYLLILLAIVAVVFVIGKRISRRKPPTGSGLGGTGRGPDSFDR
jgi:hypothetical protein